jgi:hypothetical protein
MLQYLRHRARLSQGTGLQKGGGLPNNSKSMHIVMPATLKAIQPLKTAKVPQQNTSEVQKPGLPQSGGLPKSPGLPNVKPLPQDGGFIESHSAEFKKKKAHIKKLEIQPDSILSDEQLDIADNLLEDYDKDFANYAKNKDNQMSHIKAIEMFIETTKGMKDEKIRSHVTKQLQSRLTNARANQVIEEIKDPGKVQKDPKTISEIERSKQLQEQKEKDLQALLLKERNEKKLKEKNELGEVYNMEDDVAKEYISKNRLSLLSQLGDDNASASNAEIFDLIQNIVGAKEKQGSDDGKSEVDDAEDPEVVDELNTMNNLKKYQNSLAVYQKILADVEASDLDFETAWKQIAKQNKVRVTDAWDNIDSIQKRMKINQKDGRRVTQKTKVVNKEGVTVDVNLKSMKGFKHAVGELERLINVYEEGEGIAETELAPTVIGEPVKTKIEQPQGTPVSN